MFILFSCVALIANKIIWTFTCMLPSDMIGHVIFVHAFVLAEMTLKVWNNFHNMCFTLMAFKSTKCLEQNTFLSQATMPHYLYICTNHPSDICSKNLWEFRGASFWSVQGITIGPPEFSDKSCKPPWFFFTALQNYPWSEKAPLIFLQHFLSPPENKQAKLMPPWILNSKTKCPIHSKTAIFSGGLNSPKVLR